MPQNHPLDFLKSLYSELIHFGGQQMNQFKRKPLALLVAQLVGAASLIAASPAVFAQATTGTNLEADVPTPQKLERITVTGSAIKRTQTEGALPVLTLDRAAIEQTGYTTATELIQNLPQVQNFVANSASVNGGGGGTATASLHALPSKYTLVLVDGERLAPTALTTVSAAASAATSTTSRSPPWNAWKSCWTAPPRSTDPTPSPA